MINFWDQVEAVLFQHSSVEVKESEKTALTNTYWDDII